MFDVDEPISDYQKTIRERASQSLGPLRYALDSPIKYSTASSRPTRDSSSYTTAVTRLKTLLQLYEDANTVPEQQPQMFSSESERPLDGVMSSQRSSLPNPDEITRLLNSQFAVVQHLEGQVDFYKSALEALKRQTELLIRENETLFDQLKTQALTQLLTAEQQSEKEHPSSNDKKDTSQKQTQTSGDTSGHVLGVRDDEEIPRKPEQGRGVGGTDTKVETGRGVSGAALMQRTQQQPNPRQSVMSSVPLRTSFLDSTGVGAIESQLFLSAKEKRFVLELEEEVEKIRKLHEAKTRRLESLLYSTRDELEEYQRQVSELQAKAKAQRTLAEQPAFCVKCGQQSAVFAGSHSEAAMDTINKLTRERDDLMNTLTGQKAVLAEVRQREFEAYNQVKKSCHMVEQAQLEKAEAIIHVHQLKEDLQNERQRHDKYINSSNERMEKQCEKVRAACQEEVDALVKQVESSIETRSALENKLDRVTREKVDLASELEQAKSQILTHASEMSQADVNVHKELEQTMMRHSMASQEITSLRTAAQQAAREREQERTRLAGEIEVLRRRLHDAEQGWMESKEECIALTEQLNKAEREAKSATIAKEKLVEAKSSEMENLKQQNRRREEHFLTLLQETETRHMQCRAELQQMLESEIHVCSQMKEECRKLTGQLEDTSDKSRAKVLEAKEMKKKLDECFAERRTLAEQSRRKDSVIQELTSKLKKSGENARKQIEQMSQMLATRNALMKERKVLSQEVEFLRKQWLAKQPTEPVTPVETGSNASTEDAVLHDEGKQSAELQA